MQKIIPHLWFDKEAKEAAELYVSIFPDSKITNETLLKDTPSGDALSLSFNLSGFSFMAINAGPYFKKNPSISFTVNLETPEEVQALWNKLIPGGESLMEIGSYPWSTKYGWVSDKFGVSWQIIAMGEASKSMPKIVPALMFTQEHAGQAEEAMNFYTSIFKNSKVGALFRYPAGSEPDKEGTIAHGGFTIEGQEFQVLDSAKEHKFKFNEGISLLVNCETQEEIDSLWEKLSAVPESEQCGWLKDKFGVSWQIAVKQMGEMMSAGTPEQISRVTEAFLRMKKFNIAELERAYKGE